MRTAFRSTSGRAQTTGPRVEQLETRQLLSTVVVPLGIGAPDARPIIEYMDADATRAKILLNLGLGQVTFTGDNLTTTTDHRKILVGGDNIVIDGITISQSTDRSRLSIITRGGDGDINAGAVNVAGDLKSFTAATTRFTGNMTFGGIDDIFIVKSVRDSNMSFGNGAGGVLNKFTVKRRVVDSSLNSLASIGQFSVKKWIADVSSVTMTVNAPRIDKLTVTDDFDPDLFVTGGGKSLGRATVGGEVTSDRWQVSGEVTYTRAQRFNDNFIYAVSGHVGKIETDESTGGRFALGSLGTFNVKGDLLHARFALTTPFLSDSYNLKKLSVKGTIDDLQLNSDGSVDTISAAAILNSSFFIGTDFDNPNLVAGTLPDPTTSGDLFASPAVLRSLKVGAKSDPSFVNAYVAVYTTRTVQLGNEVTVNAATPLFGIVTQSLASLKGRTSDNVPISVKRLPLLGNYFSQTRDRGMDTKNLIVFLTPQVIDEGD